MYQEQGTVKGWIMKNEGDRKGMNTSSIVDRVHHVSQLIPTSD